MPCIKLPYTVKTDTENTVYGEIDTNNTNNKQYQITNNTNSDSRTLAAGTQSTVAENSAFMSTLHPFTSIPVFYGFCGFSVC